MRTNRDNVEIINSRITCWYMWDKRKVTKVTVENCQKYNLKTTALIGKPYVEYTVHCKEPYDRWFVLGYTRKLNKAYKIAEDYANRILNGKVTFS